MSGSISLNQKANKSQNPNNCSPNSSHNFNYTVMSQHDCNAQTIQRDIRNKEVRNASKKLKETMQSETYRVNIILYLSGYSITNTCEKLLLGSEDLEVLLTFSSFDKQHVTMKARHLADALQSLADNTAK